MKVDRLVKLILLSALVSSLPLTESSRKTGASTEEGIMEVVLSCCNKGRQEAKDKNKCQGITVKTYPNNIFQKICLVSSTICCKQTIREENCNFGVAEAKETGKCPRAAVGEQWECCEACLIGKEVGAKQGTCDLGEPNFWQLTEQAYHHCCLAVIDNTQKQNSNNLGKEEENMCDMLPGELCAQTCISTGDSYVCLCNPGYVLMSDGKSCSLSSLTTTSICASCSHGCMEKDGGIICNCPPKFALLPDKVTCVDDHSARYGSTTQIIEHGSTMPMVTSAATTESRCPIGHYYHVNGTDSWFCQDIDECSDHSGEPQCDSNQECKNTIGSFICLCKAGFKRDHITQACIDINECQLGLHNCAQFQRCDNTIGSYVCVRDINCGTGYTLSHTSGKCEDDDECQLGTDTCRLLTPEGNWECVNTQGSFRCVRKQSSLQIHATHISDCVDKSCHLVNVHCPPGFTHKDNICVDVDECNEDLAKCNPNQRCINIKGNYLCSDLVKCRPGFRLNPAGTQCTDINECEEEKELCSHECENRWGTYRCRCKVGYTLQNDNRTCSDLNECEIGTRCQGFCVNLQGSYTCQCPPGYRLGINKHSCEDINECETGNPVCQEGEEICINLSGSYRCYAVICPPGYHRDPNRRTRCQRDSLQCPVNDEECRKKPASYTYNYITMTSNATIPLRSGPIKLFTVESRWGSAAPNFILNLIQVRVPPEVQAASKTDFHLKKEYGRATIELLRPLIGPQEVQLELKAEFYTNSQIAGTSVFNIDIFVSQYSY